MRKERKHYTGEEKVAILRRHLLDKVPVSDLCDELGLQPRRSLRLCLAGLRVRWFDPVAETSELPDHSRSAPLLRLFGDGGTAFLVTDSLVQDQSNQAALSMGNGPDGLIMSQARDRAAIDHLEDASFGLHGGAGGLIELILSR